MILLYKNKIHNNAHDFPLNYVSRSTPNNIFSNKTILFTDRVF